ncbi:unnamed protein product [Closterium sp. Yama58-4]|nr:unnamed protein product [Closterium sp. Yama58-4]
MELGLSQVAFCAAPPESCVQHSLSSRQPKLSSPVSSCASLIQRSYTSYYGGSPSLHFPSLSKKLFSTQSLVAASTRGVGFRGLRGTASPRRIATVHATSSPRPSVSSSVASNGDGLVNGCSPGNGAEAHDEGIVSRKPCCESLDQPDRNLLSLSPSEAPWTVLIHRLALWRSHLSRQFHLPEPSDILREAGRLFVSLAVSAVLLTSVSAPATAIVQAPPRKLMPDEQATVQLFNETTPSVVYITNLAVRRDVFTLDVMEVPQGSGSGFIWDREGHVVTNYHVIRNSSDLRVTLADQSVYAADVVGYDRDKDVAVLHIDAPRSKLRPLRVGSSFDLQVGQRVYAIGNPFGLDHTLTTGVISGLRREISSAATGRPIQDVIQTDAAINPGNSGGPLLDSNGNLIGINTAIYSPSGASSGVGFSIPADTVAGIVEQIIKYGQVTRPVLGISFAPEQSLEQLGVAGVLVLDAPPSGPAGKAGIRPTTRDSYGRLVLGDIITGIDGNTVRNGSDLYRILDRCKVGQKVEARVLRGDNEVTITITLEGKS